MLGVLGIKKAKNPNVGGKTLAIVGIILGVLSIIGWTIGIVTMVGAGVAVVKMTEPGRTAAKDWMTAASAGDIDKAASLSVDGFPREDIETVAEHLKQFGAFKDMTSVKINLQNSTLELAGAATFDKGARGYEFVVVDTGSGWKVQKVNVE